MEAYKLGSGLCPSSIELCKSQNASSILPTFVNFSALDGINRMFTLPLICQLNVDKEWCRILPSELWAIKTEVEGWNEFPCMYSYCVLRAILGLGVVRECDLAIWVSANSPQCGVGVVIDVAMRDHIILLFRLCLKAILREVLTLTWLASQLSIPYGAQNGKVFAISVLKKCISDAAMALLIFPLEQQVTESPALEEASSNLDADGNGIRNTEALKPLSTDGEGDSMMKENIINRVVFVSQVAAAVAALHERSLSLLSGWLIMINSACVSLSYIAGPKSG
ncbi:hypothetical protein ACFX15_010272 [Malus domestica]